MKRTWKKTACALLAMGTLLIPVSPVTADGPLFPLFRRAAEAAPKVPPAPAPQPFRAAQPNAPQTRPGLPTPPNAPQNGELPRLQLPTPPWAQGGQAPQVNRGNAPANGSNPGQGGLLPPFLRPQMANQNAQQAQPASPQRFGARNPAQQAGANSQRSSASSARMSSRSANTQPSRAGAQRLSSGSRNPANQGPSQRVTSPQSTTRVPQQQVTTAQRRGTLRGSQPGTAAAFRREAEQTVPQGTTTARRGNSILQQETTVPQTTVVPGTVSTPSQTGTQGGPVVISDRAISEAVETSEAPSRTGIGSRRVPGSSPESGADEVLISDVILSSEAPETAGSASQPGIAPTASGTSSTGVMDTSNMDESILEDVSDAFQNSFKEMWTEDSKDGAAPKVGTNSTGGAKPSTTKKPGSDDGASRNGSEKKNVTKGGKAGKAVSGKATATVKETTSEMALALNAAQDEESVDLSEEEIADINASILEVLNGEEAPAESDDVAETPDADVAAESEIAKADVSDGADLEEILLPGLDESEEEAVAALNVGLKAEVPEDDTETTKATVEEEKQEEEEQQETVNLPALEEEAMPVLTKEKVTLIHDARLETTTNGPSRILVGVETEYVITVRNAGNADSEDTQVLVSVPDWLMVQKCSVEQGTAAVQEKSQGEAVNCVWTLGTLKTEKELTMKLRVMPIRKAHDSIEVSWTNRQQQTQTTVEAEECPLKLTLRGSKVLERGKTYLLKANVTNRGEHDVDGVSVRVLQTGYGAEVLQEQSVGSLAAGEEKSVSFRYTPKVPGRISFRTEASVQNSRLATADFMIQVQ